MQAAHGSWVPLEGAANVHPPAAATYGLPLTPAYGLAPFAPLVAHPNGAVVPLEPKDVRIC